MSFGDEQHPEAGRPGADAHRVLDPGDLIDLKHANGRGWNAVAKVVYAFREDNAEDVMDALGTLCDVLTVFGNTLDLDSVDDDEEPKDPAGTIVEIERITRNGGRAD